MHLPSDLGRSLSVSIIFINIVSSIILHESIPGEKGGKIERNPPTCIISDGWVFDNFLLADEVFAKALSSLETSVSVNYSLCIHLVSSLEEPITFDEWFKRFISVLFFIPDFDLLSYEIDSFTFKLYFDIILK